MIWVFDEGLNLVNVSRGCPNDQNSFIGFQHDFLSHIDEMLFDLMSNPDH